MSLGRALVLSFSFSRLLGFPNPKPLAASPARLSAPACPGDPQPCFTREFLCPPVGALPISLCRCYPVFQQHAGFRPYKGHHARPARISLFLLCSCFRVPQLQAGFSAIQGTSCPSGEDTSIIAYPAINCKTLQKPPRRLLLF